MQVLDTVGWVGDGDDTDFFLAIERTFDLRLRSNLPWTTFGEVRDHVVAHVAAYSGGGTTCATQMTFYRLRRALGLGRHVGPDAPLAPLVGGTLRHAFSDLEADTDLKMPATRAGSTQERRAGKEQGGTCRSRRAPAPAKKKDDG